MFFSSIPGLYLLDANSISAPGCDNQKCLQTLTSLPWGAKSPLVMNHGHKYMKNSTGTFWQHDFRVSSHFYTQSIPGMQTMFFFLSGCHGSWIWAVWSQASHFTALNYRNDNVDNIYICLQRILGGLDEKIVEETLCRFWYKPISLQSSLVEFTGWPGTVS